MRMDQDSGVATADAAEQATARIVPLRQPGPADDPRLDLVALDDSLPGYLARPDGSIVRRNQAFLDLSARLDGHCLAPGCQMVEEATGLQRLIPGADWFARLVERVARTGVPAERQEEFVARDRRLVFRGRHFPVRDKDGAIFAVAGSYTDISEDVAALDAADQARSRFLDFARASSDWFWEADRDGRLTTLSQRFTALTGVPAVSLLGKPLTALGRLSEDEAQGMLVEAFRRRRGFRSIGMEVTSEDGDVLHFDLSGVPIFTREGGEFAGFRGSGQDVTATVRKSQEALNARTRLEEALEELTRRNMQLDLATAQAESALRARGEFLASMSHELRTPLNAIIGFAETIGLQVFGPLNERYQTYAKDIEGAGRHLLSLINDVLDVSVIESGKLNLDIEDCALAPIIDKTVNMVALRAQRKRLDLTAARYDGALAVRADERRLVQILLNLLTNAVKFTPEDGRIGVEVEGRGGEIAISVWDTGIGIPADRIEKVFDKFHQVTATIYSRSTEGTGLGLNISRELARRQGGDIGLISELDKGSRFTLTLPRA